MKTNDRALEKIQKCFALSKSANPYEAEAALRQAHKLMQKHQLAMSDVEASEITEHELVIGDAERVPAQWIIQLGEVCAEAFDCELLVGHGYRGQRLIFIGLHEKPQWASYAWRTLERQLYKARREYTATLKRCRMATRRRRGDLFARAWIYAVAELVANFAQHDPVISERLKKHIQVHHPELEELEHKDLNHAHKYDVSAIQAGMTAGERAQLHQPVSCRDDLSITAGEERA